jgi:extradiol dioxygenase family protein
MKTLPFHLALPCRSISVTRDFYVDILGAEMGRRTTQWLDINLFGNQITFTKSGPFNFNFKSYKFEDTVLPSFHFGIIIDKETWLSLYANLSNSEYEVTQEVVFLKDKKGEHRSFFVEDPKGYRVEFKCFNQQKHVFVQ